MSSELTKKELDYLETYLLHTDYMRLECGPDWREAAPARSAFYAAATRYEQAHGEAWAADNAYALSLFNRRMGRAA